MAACSAPTRRRRIAWAAPCGRWAPLFSWRRDEGQRLLARQMFERALAGVKELGPRGTALTMLGITTFIAAHPEVAPALDLLKVLAARLCARYRAQATPDWRWFEPTLTYDNALLPLALWRAYRITRDRLSREVASEALAFLEESSFHDGRLVPGGQRGLAPARRSASLRRRATHRRRGLRIGVPRRLSRDRRPPLSATHA